MKRVLYIVLFTSWFANAQIVNIPDANFKTALINLGVDVNTDGEIQESEAQTITTLDVSQSGISDLTGIEAFTNLEYLNCDLNGITSLDLSQNVNLVEFHCWHNILTDLDLSQNINLIALYCNGNPMTSLNISQNLNLVTLDCSAIDITSLDVSPNINLEYLNCSNISLGALDVSQNLNLKTLKCSGNEISTIDVSQNLNLEVLECVGNPLTAGIDLSQNINLETLICYGSQLTSIDVSQNTNLKRFECNNNQLTNLDVTQNSNLETLVCNHNQLADLDVSQNPNLIKLDIWHNQFASINVTQNPNLEELFCGENLLTSIDVTQNPNLTTLSLYLNTIGDLDLSQNTQLEYLYCLYNELTVLDVTQNVALKEMQCRNNQISELDFSQCPEFTELNCTSNQITSLDFSQNPVFKVLFAANNQLTELNVKNGSIENLLNFSNNPNLTYICVDDEQLEAINNQAPESVEVNSYCSFTPSGNFNTISGTALIDSNNNGCDVNDFPQYNVRINIDTGTDQGAMFTNTNGNYTFYTEEGNFDLSPGIENSPWFDITPELTTISFSDANNNTAVQDFCVTTNGVHNDVEIVIIPIIPARPGFDAIYQIVYKNKGNQIVSGNIDFSFDDEVLNYILSSEMPISQSTGALSWNYINLLPFESRTIEVTLNVNSPMETPAVNIGDILHYQVNISPQATDEIPTDNVFNLNQVVVGSYDPNDITCLEGDIVGPEYIGEYLHYNINFENTGTAAATFVVVKDEVDITQFDISSLQILYSSHPMMARILDHTIEFVFDDINLIPEGKGNVVFKMRSLESLVLGDFVNNKADIFFDYNFPIETNIANTVFQTLSVNEFENQTIHIYPNPSVGIVNVKAKSIIKHVELFDVQGRKVQSYYPNTLMTTLEISHINQGVYFLKVKTDIGSHLKKIIKN
ncbi:T9SS type A sorting domain-containing protein [uncultured Psychroserpens sp.]|uniref:DUF7619 domain-containing protein n=1 Tax=uncultured Psychroserpens sp. TaxID=255436 RepID=UPI00260B398C|nr:T9SS type A sorting domain-containing protein [uncultured Psychroserpens sp.]